METTTEKPPTIDTLRHVTNYIEPVLEFNRALVFTPAGAMRLASIVGWIQGIAEGGKPEIAEQLRGYLAHQLRWVCPESEKSDEFFGGPHLRRRCLLSDDGSRHGFSLLWFVLPDREKFLAAHDGKMPTRAELRARHDGRIKCWQSFQHRDEYEGGNYGWAPYFFTYNGGLLWHGPGDNSFSCCLTSSSNPWSIHT